MIESSALEQVSVQQKTKSRWLFAAFMIFFLLLIFLKNDIGVGIPVWLLLLLYGGFAIFCDRDELIALCVCCIPLSTVFQYKYAILFCMLVYAAKYTKDLKMNFIIVPLLCMMAWELLHGIFYDFSFVQYLRGFAEILLCTFIIMIANKKFDHAFIFRAFASCAVGIMIIMFIRLLIQNGWNIEKVFTGGYRFGVSDSEADEFGMNFNANGLGEICNIAFICLALVSFMKKAVKTDYVMMVALAFFGVMTMSRTFILCFAVACILLVFCGKNSLLSIIKKIAIIVATVAVVVGLIYLLAPMVIENFIKRFQVDDISNGRVDLISYYNNIIFGNADVALFGIGLQDIAGKVSTRFGNFLFVPHNGIQELLVVWGFPGLIIFVWFIILFVKNGKKQVGKLSLENYILLLFAILNIQFGQLVTSGSTLISLVIVYLTMTIDFREVRVDEQKS